MRAVTYHAFGGPLAVEQVPEPIPPPHGVVLSVQAAGLCRSDWHGWQGHDPDIRVFPHVPGHELAGTIVAVGARVRAWRVGDRVTAPFVCGCGACPACARGDHQVCAHQTQPGFTHWGAFAELVAIHHADVNLVAMPEQIAFATAASLGCRFATSFRAMVDQGRVRSGEWVAIFGCGGVGLSAVMIARALGARPIAVDVGAGARELALALGAEIALDGTAGSEVVTAIHELTGGGSDVSCDALGSAQTAADALRSLRTNGRHVQVGLLAGADVEPRLPLHLLIGRELTIVGSHGMAAHAYPRMLGMIADGRLNPSRLVTRAVNLDAVPEALRTMDTAPHPGVTVITPN